MTNSDRSPSSSRSRESSSVQSPANTRAGRAAEGTPRGLSEYWGVLRKDFLGEGDRHASWREDIVLPSAFSGPMVSCPSVREPETERQGQVPARTDEVCSNRLGLPYNRAIHFPFIRPRCRQILTKLAAKHSPRDCRCRHFLRSSGLLPSRQRLDTRRASIGPLTEVSLRYCTPRLEASGCDSRQAFPEPDSKGTAGVPQCGRAPFDQ